MIGRGISLDRIEEEDLGGGGGSKGDGHERSYRRRGGVCRPRQRLLFESLWRPRQLDPWIIVQNPGSASFVLLIFSTCPLTLELRFSVHTPLWYCYWS